MLLVRGGAAWPRNKYRRPMSWIGLGNKSRWDVAPHFVLVLELLLQLSTLALELVHISRVDVLHDVIMILGLLVLLFAISKTILFGA